MKNQREQNMEDVLVAGGRARTYRYPLEQGSEWSCSDLRTCPEVYPSFAHMQHHLMTQKGIQQSRRENLMFYYI